MGGTLWACGPGQTPSDIIEEDHRFLEFRGILLKATIAFLTALSGKQISKNLLINEGIVTQEAVEGIDDAVVIVNYRSRIDAAISLLKSWLNTRSGPRPEEPILSFFGGIGSSSSFSSHGPLGQLLAQQSALADFMAKVPIDYAALNPFDLEPEQVMVPHTLTELCLTGIHSFLLLPDPNGTLPYEKVKEVERLLRMVRSYCEFDPSKWGGPPMPPEYQPPRVRRARVPATDTNGDISASDDSGGETTHDEEDGGDADSADENDEDQQHFIDEMITVFAAVPPGGTVCT
ncbi:hypothetical protein GGX14DRAFT_477787 [Mycena pura]|uniref:Uncharacterized protein n=1 Tax=Mycena pura TaxID=153505 RepID=A0AAD6Y6L7_9AGAR|nr:hypothetical protein GGX14DRAFT_477787 [Mycena pura]